MKSDIRLIHFNPHVDDRGSLIAIEGSDGIPFDIQRVFYVFGMAKNTGRGMHALKTAEEVIICLKGKCICRLDDGVSKEEIILDNPQQGLYIGKTTWIELYSFSRDCILLCLSNKKYDQLDRISDYHEFLKYKECED
jgi:dTDP-4-dehydrorhamnose 3,5-epimerase-like enzyme